MAMSTTRPVGRPRLFKKKISIGFTPEQVQVIQEMQRRDGLTFGDAVRELVNMGMEIEGS